MRIIGSGENTKGKNNMRIIGSGENTKDYYDCIQKYGQDKSVLYLRKPEEDNSLKAKKLVSKLEDANNIRYFNRNYSFIGVCGKIYLCFYFHKIIDNETQYHYLYSLDEIFNYAENKLTRKEFITWKQDRYPRYKDTFEYWEAHREDYKSFFEDKKCPIFISSGSDEFNSGFIVWNDNLSNYHFYKVMPPQIIFQEIYKWLSNQAQPDKTIPIISDVLKAESKGFDKFSFRKAPTKKQ